MLASWKVALPPQLPNTRGRGNLRGFRCRAETLQTHANGEKRKVVIVGSGWAGLGAAHHLCNQGFDVTVLEGDNGFGYPDTVATRGYYRTFQNIFSLVDELGIKPFTNWTKSAQYSEEGLEVEFPVFQDLPQLPTPLGTLYYSQFLRLPLLDRLTFLPLVAAGKVSLHYSCILPLTTHNFPVIDFDNTDTAWRKYDSITARELFKQFGCSERLYRDILRPLVHVGLFAPAEQCSAAATLGLLNYVLLAHQKDFDLAWCRGAVKEKFFAPWMDSLRDKGCEFLENRTVTDLIFDEETGSVSEVVCGRVTYKADAVILAVGVYTLQEFIRNSPALRTREDFLKVLNLGSIDVLTVKLRLDQKVNIPIASNACSGFDDSFGWTFFDLNVIQDEHKNDSVTVLQADFYRANELLPLKDEQIITKVTSCLSKYIKDFEVASVVDKEIGRYPNSLTHFFPGSYKYMMRGSTSFPNLFMAGDWIVNRHGSWGQEKSYVTGLEAANRVVDYLEEGSFAKILPVEEAEPHIQTFRSLNRNFNDIRTQLPLSNYFLQ
ncbi:NAD(P)-binding domain containing protein [Senna tora]|uniref:NAD(P)-binding domain containing protein n=1 Tax=Senna tora TaxID=362788 RepID=A0A834SVV3_9FABA|nr:NAD(P)-binding domain containing protein [Senna tora]